MYDDNGTSPIADCGKISIVNTVDLVDLTSQTYTLLCNPSTKLASYVELIDSELEVSDKDFNNQLVMNIAEVTVYGTAVVRPDIGKSENLTATLIHTHFIPHTTQSCPYRPAHTPYPLLYSN